MKIETKQKLLDIARRARLLPLLERVRFLRSKHQSAPANAAFRNMNPEFTPPPLWWMHDMYRHTSFDLYWQTGKETADVIAQKIDQHCAVTHPRVADWGCGLARVLRHLPARYERTGLDYNHRAIAWAREQFGDIAFHENELLPPLPAMDAQFDCVYALSVFTHLSEAAHMLWINEIDRVLAPGGILIAAFHMRPYAGQLLPAEQKQFDSGALVVRGGVKEGSRIFTAHHPEIFLRNRLFANFDIVEGPFDIFGQEAFTVRKR